MEVFVYLVENYHMKGDAYWMDNETLNKYIDRAQKIAPNVIGNLAPELKMVDTAGKPISLSSINSKYTLLIFWAPDCGHCQAEMPKIDSLYKAADLKKKGVTIYAVKTNGADDDKLWKDFIKQHNLQYWTNVNDPEHKSAYKSQYDVYATPMIYLLDDKKIIRGKKIDHTNIMTLLEMLENKTSKNTNK
jgi:thiol-disulfide isomerase/thioredoxin